MRQIAGLAASPFGDQLVRDVQIFGYVGHDPSSPVAELGLARTGGAVVEGSSRSSPEPFSATVIGPQNRIGHPRVAETALCHATFYTTSFVGHPLYFSELANARPRLAFEVCAPAQNGTAIYANAFCESHTSLKNAFSAAFFSSEALAAFM